MIMNSYPCAVRERRAAMTDEEFWADVASSLLGQVDEGDLDPEDFEPEPPEEPVDPQDELWWWTEANAERRLEYELVLDAELRRRP